MRSWYSSNIRRHSVHQALPDPTLRRVLIGIAMGMTAIGIIYSPLGQRSGAHFNPAVTLTFFRLGKVEFWDAAFYGAAQFIGGLLGVVLSALVLGELVAHPSVRYAATVPGMAGVGVAFLAEARHLLPADVSNLALLQHPAPGAFYRPVRRRHDRDRTSVSKRRIQG